VITQEREQFREISGFLFDRSSELENESLQKTVQEEACGKRQEMFDDVKD